MVRDIFKVFCVMFLFALSANAITLEVEPLSKNVLIKYNVPQNAGQEVIVFCEYSSGDGKTFQPAMVRKYRSITAERLLRSDKQRREEIKNEMLTGTVKEYMASGLERTLVWQVSGQLNYGKLNNIVVKITIKDVNNVVLANDETNGAIDLKDVVVLSDFSKVLQKNELALEQREGAGWYWITPKVDEQYGCLRSGKSPFKLNPLTLRPKLRGYYAIYVGLPYKINPAINLRLSDELYDQRFDSTSFDPRECFWKIADLTSRNIVISQWDLALASNRTGIHYIRLVPVSEDVYKESKKLDSYERDKLVAGHSEPFSWAASKDITDNSQFAGAYAAFRDSKMDWVDIQMGRLGARPVYPTELDEPIVTGSHRETGPGTNLVKQTGSSLMSMSTDAFEAMKVFSAAFNVPCSANFGAGVAYRGSDSLRSVWAENNGQYLVNGNWPQYRYKPVRDAALAYYKEFLDRGAKRLTVEFCRYPYVIDVNDSETATLFLRELRTLADSYSNKEDKIKILVKFPVPGVRGVDRNYNPKPWVDEKLVDVIVPSTIAASMDFFDVAEYVKMTRGTGTKCMPCVILLNQGIGSLFPGQVIRKVDQLYDAGCDGVYLYQSDGMIIGWMSYDSAWARPIIARFGSSAAVREMVKEADEHSSEYSRDIYISYIQSYATGRAVVLIEGFVPERVETFMNEKAMNVFDANDCFYRIGWDGWKNDYPASATPVDFIVKAKINNEWFTKKSVVEKIYKVSSPI